MEFNPADLMKNFQNIQGKMKDVQDKLKDVTATGTSGGGLVKITINGELKVLSVDIDKIAVDPRDIEMLQDLVMAAFNSAQENIKDRIQEEVKGASGLNMPFDLSGLTK